MTSGARLTLAMLLLHVQTYEGADPVAWADRRQLAVLSGLSEATVRDNLRMLRKAGYVGESVSRTRRGFTQYGYRLGPLATGAASDEAASMVDAMNLMVREERRARDPRNTFTD